MLNFIGHGSAFNTALGNNGAYIKKDKVLFMIDCGSNTFDRMMKLDILNDVEHIYILMTHTHPDHVGSLGDLIFYGYYSMGELMKPSVTVIAPCELDMRSLLRQMGVTKEYYLNEFGIDVSQRGFADGNFSILVEVVPVNHVAELNCFGYILHYENKTAYYSGDSNDIPIGILDKLHMGYFDYFYQDTCKADYEGNVHLSLRKLDEMIDWQYRPLVYCMHLDKDFDVEEAEELGFGVVNN